MHICKIMTVICYFHLFCVALKLDADNMGMVLRKTGIDESNWKEIASALGLSRGFIEGLIQTGMGWIGKYGFKDVLSNWQDQESSRGAYVSWDKLAEAIQNVKKYGVDYSQTILEISGEGRV